MEFNKLTPDEERVILQKGTEMPFTGKYHKYDGAGTYICKRCNTPLYKSESKFDAHCGWPSFDDEISGAVKRQTDADGRRIEIICNKCEAHLGHVFLGEGFTSKNTRHCVNSISLNFVPYTQNVSHLEKAIFAGGCFWGVEYYMERAKGVVSTRVGYIGGNVKNPSYKEVCSHATGHAEAIEVTFNANETNYEEIAKLFFEIHDPTQEDGQGPDIGDQYRSEVFYTTDEQKVIAEKLINILKERGLKVVTNITKASEFYQGEEYHQKYYDHKGTLPYCHAYAKKF